MTGGADTDHGADLIEIPVIFPNAGLDSRETWAELLADSFGANAAERHALRQAAIGNISPNAYEAARSATLAEAA